MPFSVKASARDALVHVGLQSGESDGTAFLRRPLRPEQDGAKPGAGDEVRAVEVGHDRQAKVRAGLLQPLAEDRCGDSVNPAGEPGRRSGVGHEDVEFQFGHRSMSHGLRHLQPAIQTARLSARQRMEHVQASRRPVQAGKSALPVSERVDRPVFKVSGCARRPGTRRARIRED